FPEEARRRWRRHVARPPRRHLRIVLAPNLLLPVACRIRATKIAITARRLFARRGGVRLETVEVSEAQLDEGPDPVLEAGLARELECLLVARPHLRRRDSLLQPVVADDEQLLNPLPGFAPRRHVP